jgi:hypothetical protein
MIRKSQGGTGDLSGILEDSHYPPETKARKQTGEVLCR